MYSEKKKKSLLFRNLRKQYLLRIQDAVSLHDRVFFKISKFRVYISAVLIAFLLIGATTLLIAFTDLRRFIPGYSDADMIPIIYEMNRKVDSLEYVCLIQNNYLENLRNILTGNITLEDTASQSFTPIVIDNIRYAPSREDSILRGEIEAVKDYTLQERVTTNKLSSFADENFVLPILGGTPTSHFSRVNRHYDIDLVGKAGSPVLSTLDGTVIFNDWAIETGHVLVVQHKNDLISVYKHNSSLLKKAGDYVRAGDPIAIIGNSGEFTTGQHLHFELWYKGIPLNPADYLIF
ncbi:MAG: M23 family metallopeptidase [Bacteroidales bacterium]|nr:M23 family metallopeptidase [Bacteroidales bacterium]